MHGDALGWILVVVADDGLPCEFRNAHDAVGIVHTVLFDTVNGGVHLSARAVEVGGMHVDDEWLSAHLLGMYACREGEPVVGVDDVEFTRTGNDAGNDVEVTDFLVEVFGITSCEVQSADVVGALVAEVGIDMVAELVVFFGCQVLETSFEPFVVGVAPNDGDLVHAQDVQEFLLFTAGLWQAEGGLDTGNLGKTLGDTIGCHSKSAVNLRGKLPAKH